MVNGNCPTWFVQRWLEKHQTHTAKAPDTDDLFPCEASTDGMHVVYSTKWPPDVDEREDGSPPIRNDWTLYRADGKLVKFKKREKLVRNGEYTFEGRSYELFTRRIT